MAFRLVLFLLFLASAVSFFGQSLNTGTFLGSVKDQSGAVVPGATVRVLRDSPLFQREVTSDGEGNYQMPQVPAGEYRIEFEKPGFQKTIHKIGRAHV